MLRDWANAIGYVALSLLLVLFVYRGRARAFPTYSVRFFANLHRDLGYIALLMVAVHMAMLLLAEPLLLEHMQPTAPLHMSSGLLTSVLILILVTSSIPRPRGFVSCWPLATVSHEQARTLAFCAGRLPSRACSAAGCLEHYRSGHASLEPLLPVSFEHADHTDTPCAQCHHNFLDETGGGTCYNCHKYAEDIAAQMQSLFHDFCFGCHMETRSAGDDSGPMRARGGCHPR